MKNEYEEVMSKRSDDELIDIVTINRDVYQSVAVLAAEKEIENRGIDLNQFKQKREQNENAIINEISNNAIDYPIKILRSTKVKTKFGDTIALEYKSTRFDFIFDGNIAKVLVNGEILGASELDDVIYTFIYTGEESIKVNIWTQNRNILSRNKIGMTIDGIPIENSLSDPRKKIKRATFMSNGFFLLMLLIKFFHMYYADLQYHSIFYICLISILLISILLYKKKSKIPLLTGIIIGTIESIDFLIAIILLADFTNYWSYFFLVVRISILRYMISAVKLFYKGAKFK